MDIDKDTLARLFEDYERVLSEFDKYEDFIQIRYKEKYRLDSSFYLNELKYITSDTIVYEIVDREGDTWPWSNQHPNNDGITIKELCMNEDDWELHLVQLREKERERIDRLNEANKAKYDAAQREQKYNEYLKLKKEFEDV